MAPGFNHTGIFEKNIKKGDLANAIAHFFMPLYGQHATRDSPVSKSYRTLYVEGSVIIKRIPFGSILRVGNLGKVEGLDPKDVFTKAPSAIQSLMAMSSIAVASDVIPVTSTSNITLISTPNIQTTNITDGYVIRIINVGSFTITLQAQRLLVNSRLSMGVANTKAIPPGLFVQFVFYGGLWYLAG